MNRRELFKITLAAGAATSASAQHAAHTIAPAGASATDATVWKPLLFDAHQNATVTTIAELIIPRTDTPGARDAKVNEYIDLILNDGSAEARTSFLLGLGWVDGYAIRQNGKPFVQCTPAQQNQMLTAMYEGKGEGHAFFRQIKSLTAEGYYTTKLGVDELNKGAKIPSTWVGHKAGDH